MAFAAHILTSGRVGMMASPGGGSSFSDSSFLPEEYIWKQNWTGQAYVYRLC